MKHTGRPRKLSDAEICEKYAELGDSVMVGLMAGCSATTVTTVVRRAGGVVRPRGGPVRRPSTLSVEDVCRRYLDGESGASIARAAGTYPALIYEILVAGGVTRRAQGWHMSRGGRIRAAR